MLSCWAMIQGTVMIDKQELHRCVQLASELEQRLEKIAYATPEDNHEQNLIENLQWENNIMFNTLLNCLQEITTGNGDYQQLLNIVHHTVLDISEKRKIKEYTL